MLYFYFFMYATTSLFVWLFNLRVTNFHIHTLEALISNTNGVTPLFYQQVTVKSILVTCIGMLPKQLELVFSLTSFTLSFQPLAEP